MGCQSSTASAAVSAKGTLLTTPPGSPRKVVRQAEAKSAEDHDAKTIPDASNIDFVASLVEAQGVLQVLKSADAVGVPATKEVVASPEKSDANHAIFDDASKIDMIATLASIEAMMQVLKRAER